METATPTRLFAEITPPASRVTAAVPVCTPTSSRVPFKAYAPATSIVRGIVVMPKRVGWEAVLPMSNATQAVAPLEGVTCIEAKDDHTASFTKIAINVNSNSEGTRIYDT